MPSAEEIEKAHKVLFDAGIEVRTAVAGREYVERSLKAGSTSFSRPMQELVTGTSAFMEFPSEYESRINIKCRILLALDMGSSRSRTQTKIPP